MTRSNGRQGARVTEGKGFSCFGTSKHATSVLTLHAVPRDYAYLECVFSCSQGVNLLAGAA